MLAASGLNIMAVTMVHWFLCSEEQIERTYKKNSTNINV